MSIIDSSTVEAKWMKGIPILTSESYPVLKFSQRDCKQFLNEKICNSDLECSWTSDKCEDKQAPAQTPAPTPEPEQE